MSYPDPVFRDDAGLHDEPRFRGDPGFRDELDLPPDSSTPTGAYPPPPYIDGSSTDTTLSRPVSAAELDDVFDDPEHGQPGMDRMGVHVLWEVILLVGVVLLAFFLRRWHGPQITGDSLRTLLLDAAPLGVICTAMALSLRAGVVNLAVGPIAAAAGVFFARHSDGGIPAAAGEAALLAVAVGAMLGLAVVVFQVPPWAVTLAGALAVFVWIQKQSGPVTVAGYDPSRHAIYWYAGFAALSVLGGLLGLFKTVRRGLSRFRPVADPARRRGPAAGLVAFLALIGSSVLAALGGCLDAMASRTVDGSDGGWLVTAFALGAVLAGGTSAFGRRGGIFGTLLAVTLLVLFVNCGVAADWRISPYAVAAGAIGVGLVVTRLVETLGKPRSADADGGIDTWGGVGRDRESTHPGWGGSERHGTWGSQLPARSIDDTWGGGASDERWGAR